MILGGGIHEEVNNIRRLIFYCSSDISLLLSLFKFTLESAHGQLSLGTIEVQSFSLEVGL